MRSGNSTTLLDKGDESLLEEWERKLGQSGRIKIIRSKPKDEFPRETYPNRRKKMGKEKNSSQNHSLPQPARIVQPKPFSLLERITQLVNLQEKKDKCQGELKEIEAKHAQVLAVCREAKEQIYSQLNTITSRDLAPMQSQFITADEKEAGKMRSAVKNLSEIANKTQQPNLANSAESYLKTAEAFRPIWQGLTPEQREERALVARVSPDNAKAFYRAALAYQKDEATKFLEMLPPQWRESIEGKTPTPEIAKIEAKS